MTILRKALVLTLLLGCASGFAHDPEKPNRHQDRFEHYEGTKTCLECHEEEALSFFDSQHYQWRGGTPDVVNTGDAETLGKLTMVNDFCTNPGGSQWIGRVFNEEGKTLAKGCSGCHAGLGKLPGKDPTPEQLENIDCLMCHASGYRRDLYATDNGEWEWRPILHENQEGLDSVSKRIDLPNRAICLRCHAASGGGPNFKRGDIEYALKDPDYEHDVHMSSKKEGGQDLWCIDCHTDDTHTHRVIGRGVDMSATDRPDKSIDCSSACHQGLTHATADIDKHQRLSCPTCHIPEFAKDDPTDMFRDWSTIYFSEKKGKYMYTQELEYDVEPVYAWFNGSSFVLVPGKPVQRNDKGELTMILPQGDRNDPTAKIAPFKLHRGVLPVLTEKQWIAPVLTEEVYRHGDANKAVREGIHELYGIEDADFTWEKTIRYMGIYHAIPPSGDALECVDCHSTGGRMRWRELGYESDPYPMQGSSE